MALLWLFKLPYITRDTVIVTLEKPHGFSPAQACSPTLVPHPGHVCSAPCLHSLSSCLFPSLQARYYLLRLTLLVLSALDPHFRLCLSAFFWISWDCMNAGLPKVTLNIGFPGSSVSKESACHAGEQGSVSGWGRYPGEGNHYPLQYSCLENLMDREVWWATVHEVARGGHDLVTKPTVDINEFKVSWRVIKMQSIDFRPRFRISKPVTL